jgi:hypothetical protein
VGWDALTASDKVEAANWIGERLHRFAHDVGSVVPPGFDAYARIFHPAWRSGDKNELEVRWSNVAAWSGRTVHPEMQFHSIAAPVPGRQTGPRPWSREPRLGVLSNQQAVTLIGLLSKYTSNADRCWFCLWDGYGYFHPGAIAAFTFTYVGPPRFLGRRWWEYVFIRLGRRPKLERPLRPPTPPPYPGPPPPTEPRVHLPGRDYVLFNGSVGQSAGWEDGPNLWWPDDRSWCVASEIDFPYTYVGGSTKLIEEILAHPLLEALTATIDQGITAVSDTVNS